MTPDDKRHGTYAGAQRHRRDGEQPCQPCRDAFAAYQRKWRASDPDNRRRELEANRARSRAVWQLVDAHRDEYERLYAAALTSERAAVS